jgi:glycosyltransferase involved in cell wall biosynthesis
MEQKVFDAALHVVTWSDWARRSVIGEHGLKESKVSTIPPGARLWEMGDPVFERKAKPRILFVGHDFERKGGWDLLNVFLDHFSDKAELHLVTKALQFDRPLKNVSVHTGVSSYTKPWHDLFRDSDIFVLLSRNEPFGLALQEAGGYGLALIGSNVGAIPELVRDGSNGFVIEPGDRLQLERCLRVLIEDHDLRMRIRRQSRQVALEAFDARKNYARLAALFSLAGACTQGKMSHACSG